MLWMLSVSPCRTGRNQGDDGWACYIELNDRPPGPAEIYCYRFLVRGLLMKILRAIDQPTKFIGCLLLPSFHYTDQRN